MNNQAVIKFHHNPAHQDPPFKVLRLGNLPVDVSRDELEAIFLKQKGYKKLSLMIEPPGATCIVEFEDESCAKSYTDALREDVLRFSAKGQTLLAVVKAASSLDYGS